MCTSVCLCRAAEAVLKGQVETIVSFHIQNISNSKAERNTVPLVGNTCMWVGKQMVNVLECVRYREMDDYLCSEISFRVGERELLFYPSANKFLGNIQRRT